MYNLLDTLAVVPPGDLKLPLDTGIHAATEFNAEAARSVGFSAEAVKVMSSIPYLEHGLYLQPHTYTKSFLGLEKSSFHEQRFLINGLDDYLAPESTIQLTSSDVGFGIVYVYDAERSKKPDDRMVLFFTLSSDLLITDPKTMFPRSIINDPPVDDDERDPSVNYSHASVESKPPREALQPVINRFRSLQYVNRPPWSGTDDELLVEESHYSPAGVENSKTLRTPTEGDRKRLFLRRRLQNLYLQCGWDIDAIEQPTFRRGEFLEKRRVFLNGFFGVTESDGGRP